jgi:hypothetical protein
MTEYESYVAEPRDPPRTRSLFAPVAAILSALALAAGGLALTRSAQPADPALRPPVDPAQSSAPNVVN